MSLTNCSLYEDPDAEVYQVTAKSVSILDVMHPLWFGKKHGWHGTTYDDAVEFCKNVRGMGLCPLEGKIISNNTK